MMIKNFFRTFAFVVVLTTACGKNEIVNDGEGYILPITVNVNRQDGEYTTKATFNDETKKLSFSTGDQLFVEGYHPDARSFAGTLAWVSDGTFSGAITTENEWTGTVEELFGATYPYGHADATLLPAGYSSKGFLSIMNEGYSAFVGYDYEKAFALTKAEAVEQFSDECGSYTSGTGFVLSPTNAILNFTITGLSASTNVNVLMTLPKASIDQDVTTDGSGNATFAIAVYGGAVDLNDISLSVGGNVITLGSHELLAGKIYNVTRLSGHALSSASVGDIICSDGYAYPGTDYDKLPTGVTAVARVCYKNGVHGLALALADEGSMIWENAGPACSSKTPAITGCTWRLATLDEWKAMVGAVGGYLALRDGFEGIGGTNMQSAYYWSSSYTDYGKWAYHFDGPGADVLCNPNYSFPVRACLSF